MLWLISFSHCIPGSVNLLYILISRARCTPLRCQPWMKIYCRLVRERICLGDQPGVSGEGRGKSNWFPSQFPSHHMPVEFFPRIQHYYLSLSITRGSELIRSILIRRWFSELISHDNFFVWLFRLFPASGPPPSPSHLNTPQDVTWRSLKVVPPDNLLILVRLIDESIAEIPRACSRIRLIEGPFTCFSRSILTPAGGRRNLHLGLFFSGSNYWTSCCCYKKDQPWDRKLKKGKEILHAYVWGYCRIKMDNKIKSIHLHCTV